MDEIAGSIRGTNIITEEQLLDRDLFSDLVYIGLDCINYAGHIFRGDNGELLFRPMGAGKSEAIEIPIGTKIFAHPTKAPGDIVFSGKSIPKVAIEYKLVEPGTLVPEYLSADDLEAYANGTCRVSWRDCDDPKNPLMTGLLKYDPESDRFWVENAKWTDRLSDHYDDLWLPDDTYLVIEKPDKTGCYHPVIEGIFDTEL